ncbi:MAG: hypothetical protein U5P41_09665 [Gammaproteobacteria bacterium]|nr:hypothetical protein [Gammaproteobacteria bacterium]
MAKLHIAGGIECQTEAAPAVGNGRIGGKIDTASVAGQGRCRKQLDVIGRHIKRHIRFGGNIGRIDLKTVGAAGSQIEHPRIGSQILVDEDAVAGRGGESIEGRSGIVEHDIRISTTGRV